MSSILQGELNDSLILDNNNNNSNSNSNNNSNASLASSFSSIGGGSSNTSSSSSSIPSKETMSTLLYNVQTKDVGDSVIQNQLLQIVEILILVYYGILDSFKVMLAFKILMRSKQLQSLYQHCIMLNGIIFLGSYLVYLYWVDPTIEYLLHQLPAATNVFSFIYCLLWVYPIYIFSIAANSKWYSQIASESFRISGFRSSDTPSSVNRILSSIVDEIYRNLMFGVFLILSVIIAFIPYTSLINFVLVTWLYSFWCFDNKWILRGKWTLMQRITYFELHWAYMFGYGAVFTLASFFFPMLIGNAIFSLLYPLFIILSVGAKPVKLVRKGLIPRQIPIFYISEKIVNIFLKFFVLKKDGNNQPQTSSSSPTLKPSAPQLKSTLSSTQLKKQ